MTQYVHLIEFEIFNASSSPKRYTEQAHIITKDKDSKEVEEFIARNTLKIIGGYGMVDFTKELKSHVIIPAKGKKSWWKGNSK